MDDAKSSSMLFLVLAFVATSIVSGQETNHTRSQQPPHVRAGRNAAGLSSAFRQAVKQVSPAVVTIETLSGPRKTIQWAIRETSLHQKHRAGDSELACLHCAMDDVRDGTGSGIIIDRRGFVLTCHHVIKSADVIFVRLPDGRRFEAVDVREDPLTDLAVIRVAADRRLPEIRLGNSSDLQVGDWVVSVGDPYGLGTSVSAGIVSATDRRPPDTPRMQLIQTDAASNPGNSGGALVNLQGEVVGISQGGYGTGEGFQGIGFAIPVDAAIRIARQLIKHGEIRRAYLGCDTEMLTPEVAQHLGMTQHAGIIVCAVTPRSPADVAGIKVGDVLTHFSGTPIQDGNEMQQLIEEASPDKRYSLTLFRDGESVSINVRLGQLHSDEDAIRKLTGTQPKQLSGFFDERFGLGLDELSPEMAKQLGYENGVRGVLVTDVTPGQVAYKNGLCAGMVILQVGSQSTRSLTDYGTAMRNTQNEKGVLMLIGAPEGKHFVLLQRES